MADFRSYLLSRKRILFDGAMGTMLQMRGLNPGVSPEEFCLEHPDILEGVHFDYARAGSNVLTTNTFGGTCFKLPAGMNIFDFNRHMASVARRAADKAQREVFVAGSIGPTGKFLRPLGDLAFEDMVKAYQEQIRGLLAGGIDLVLGETQFDLAEARAIVIAARRESHLPVAISMTYEEGVTLTGSSVAVCAATLVNMGIDLVGINCSAGPLEMQGAVTELISNCSIPVLVQPNAGLPQLVGERTVFPLQPEAFAAHTRNFALQGAQAVGGCCGTTPDHIAALGRAIADLPAVAPRVRPLGITVTSRSSLVHIGENFPVCIIGERITPTGKKQLTADLQAGEFGTALRFAEEQLALGAPVLDVNVGAPLVDEVMLLPQLVERLVTLHSAPLSLDSSNAKAIAAAFAVYPASPLVNSISGEDDRMDLLGPLCRDFGAPFVLLPLRGKELPVKASQRIAIVEDLLARMDSLAIPRSLAMVDILALSASSSADAAKECLTFIRYCREVLHLPTVCGLSNISFGLPARELVNSTFLALAAGAGLSACIANPSSSRITEAVDATNLLFAHDEGAEAFIGKYAGWKSGVPGATGSLGQPGQSGGASSRSAVSCTSIEQAVISGRRDSITALVQAALDAGDEPFSIVGERLIPAITEVGVKYERKEYFLPQLIRSAETMQTAFALLQPLLEKDVRSSHRPVVIMATVEGDIHDIGKNIVSLMLGNHGFEIVDLGKDVKATEIIDAARTHKASIIGLSALMTTTMVRMQDTVNLLQNNELSLPVMVGGAVVTDAFARSIGAHYARDAVDAVRLAQELMQ